jgi:small-conductance mechanosensitive channel
VNIPMELINSELIEKVLKAIFAIVAGYFFTKVFTRILAKTAGSFLDEARRIIFEKFSFYFVFLIVIFTSLTYVGIDLKVLLGAAGIFTVAIGFAAQTSASNLISGIFLMSERPFSVGDIVEVGTTTGVVLSIDLFSTRIRTFNNKLIRIPNEVLMKSQITNITHFDIRRLDLRFGVHYDSDLKKVEAVLREVVSENPKCLDEPDAVFIIDSLDDSCISLQFSVWTKKDNFVPLKNELLRAILESFREHHIEIPYPQTVLHIDKAVQQQALD